MSSSNLFRAPARAPFFRELLIWLLATMAFCLIPNVFAADDVRTKVLSNSDFSSAREALIESIEAEGLVVSAVLPFADMLARTADALEQGASPFLKAEIIQFCSARLARQLVDEDSAQIALCPLTITVFSTRQAPGLVSYAYRSPGKSSAGRKAAGELLEKLLARASQLARTR